MQVTSEKLVGYKHRRIAHFVVKGSTDVETGQTRVFRFDNHIMKIPEDWVPEWEKVYLGLLPIDQHQIVRLKEVANEEDVLAESARTALGTGPDGGSPIDSMGAIRGPVGTGDIKSPAKAIPAVAGGGLKIGPTV